MQVQCEVCGLRGSVNGYKELAGSRRLPKFTQTTDLISATVQITSHISLLNPTHQPESSVCLCGQLTGSEWLLCLPFYKRTFRVYGKLTGNQWFLCPCVGVQRSIHVCLCGCTAWKYTHAYTYACTHTHKEWDRKRRAVNFLLLQVTSVLKESSYAHRQGCNDFKFCWYDYCLRNKNDFMIIMIIMHLLFSQHY